MKLVAAEMEEVRKKEPALCAESHYTFLDALDLVGFRRFVRGDYDSSSTSASICPAFTAATKAA